MAERYSPSQKRAIAKRKSSSSSSSSSSGTSFQAVTRQTKDGGTQTVTAGGIITTRDADGRLISRTSASNKSSANAYVQSQGQQIAQETAQQQSETRSAEQRQTLQSSPNTSLSSSSNKSQGISQLSTKQSINDSQRQSLSSQQKPDYFGTDSSSQYIGGTPYLKPEVKQQSKYQKMDKALFGFLPGGVTPEQEVPKRISEMSPAARVVTRTVISSSPILSYIAGREEVAKAANVVLKPVTERVIISKEFATSQAKKQFDLTKKAYKAGKISDTGLAIIGVAGGKTFKEAVKQDKPFSESISPGIKTISDKVFGVTGELRSKPYQAIEAGVQTYYTSKTLGTVFGTGGELLTKGSGSTTGFLARTALRFGQTEALYKTTEQIFKGKGFSKPTSSAAAFGATVLQAEGFGNIEGAREMTRLGEVEKGLGLKKTFWEGFKRKVRPGIQEGGASAIGLINYKGKQSVDIPFTDYTVSFSKSYKPSFTETKSPAVDTLKDSGYNFKSMAGTEAEFKSFEKEFQSKAKTTTRDGLKNFDNVIFETTDTNKKYTLGTKFDAQTRKEIDLGKGGAIGISAGIGIITAGTFGGVEAIFSGTKYGRAAIQAVGYRSDLPELPGDIGTDLGFGTSFVDSSKYIKPKTSTLTFTQEIGDFANLGSFGKSGGTLTKTEAKVRGGNVNIDITQRKIDIKPQKTQTFDFGGTKNSGKGKTKTQNFDFGLTKPSGKGNIYDVSNIKTPTKRQATVPVFSDITQLTKPRNKQRGSLSFSVSDVKSPIKTDNNIPAISETPTKDVVNIFNNTNNSVSSLTNNFISASTNTSNQTSTNTNVFTGKLFPFVLPGGGGGRGYKPKKKGKSREFGYLPSIAAIGLGIKGKRSGVSTGLEVRPIDIRY